MKTKIITLVCLAFVLHTVAGQDYSKLEEISLKDKAECAANEGLVLECSNYLMKSTIDEVAKDKNHLNAGAFIMRWMEATPDYTFTLDEDMVKATNSEQALLGILLASMSIYVLENKSDEVNDVKYNAFLSFIIYCENPKNKVTLDDYLKSLIKARDENNLKEFLNIRSNAIITML